MRPKKDAPNSHSRYGLLPHRGLRKAGAAVDKVHDVEVAHEFPVAIFWDPSLRECRKLTRES